MTTQAQLSNKIQGLLDNLHQPVYHPTTILSENSKTDCSINLPTSHCTPTINCKACCYARRGSLIRPSNKKKQQWVSDYLLGSDLSEIIRESRRWTAIRLSASGDLLPGHLPNILRLAEATPQTMWWGMTRKIPVAVELNGKLPNLKVMVSVDASSPETVWEYPGALCYGPRKKEDQVPDDSRIKTVFPYHSSGKVTKGVPRHPKDCLAIWHENDGCLSCGQCWKW